MGPLEKGERCIISDVLKMKTIGEQNSVIGLRYCISLIML